MSDLMSEWSTNFGLAWLALGVAFGLHVADETAHDFLAWYNPIARRLRRFTGVFRFPPIFTFWAWLVGLAAVTAVVLALTPWAFERRPLMRPLAIAFAGINTGNGLLHIVAAVTSRRRVPGVLSAPLLLAASLWVLTAAAHPAEAAP